MTWLDAQKSATSQDKNDRIEILKSQLEFTKLSVEQLKPDKDFIIVPVNGTFRSFYKGKNPTTVLVLKVKKLGSIIEGNIVQFFPVNGQPGAFIPANTFFNIYNDKQLEVEGRFTFLSINDNLYLK